MMFENRKEAGRMLADKLKKLDIENPVVFGLPRGGVITAREVAKALSSPLDIIICRKLGTPGNPELAFGAIAPKGIEYIDWEFAEKIGIKPFEIRGVIKDETKELKRREKLYRGGKRYPNLANKVAIIVDDGIATGATVKAAIEFAKILNPVKVIVASPVCAKDTSLSLLNMADKVICLLTPDDFYAVGQFYQDFPQTTDEEVIDILKT